MHSTSPPTLAELGRDLLDVPLWRLIVSLVAPFALALAFFGFAFSGWLPAVCPFFSVSLPGRSPRPRPQIAWTTAKTKRSSTDSRRVVTSQKRSGVLACAPQPPRAVPGPGRRPGSPSRSRDILGCTSKRSGVLHPSLVVGRAQISTAPHSSPSGGLCRTGAGGWGCRNCGSRVVSGPIHLRSVGLSWNLDCSSVYRVCPAHSQGYNSWQVGDFAVGLGDCCVIFTNWSISIRGPSPSLAKLANRLDHFLDEAGFPLSGWACQPWEACLHRRHDHGSAASLLIGTAALLAV